MRYKVFGRHTGLRVSELVLGTGVFGTRWGHGADPDEARRILDAYAEAGGNFIDTADTYQFGESEELLGQFLQGRRDDFVLATKFTQGATPEAGILVTGNSRKAMVASLEASLRRLRTDRIDLYWVHYADGVTPVEEIVRGFDDLVRGRQDPLCRALRLPGLARRAGGDHRGAARLRRRSPGSRSSTAWSSARRSRNCCRWARRSDLASSPGRRSAAVCSPASTAAARPAAPRRLGGRVFQPENSAQRTAILDTVIAVAEETGATPSQVAIAWVASKGPLPIIGPRTLEQLGDNLGATRLQLTPEQARAPRRGERDPAGVPLHGGRPS